MARTGRPSFEHATVLDDAHGGKVAHSAASAGDGERDAGGVRDDVTRLNAGGLMAPIECAVTFGAGFLPVQTALSLYGERSVGVPKRILIAQLVRGGCPVEMPALAVMNTETVQRRRISRRFDSF